MIFPKINMGGFMKHILYSILALVVISSFSFAQKKETAPKTTSVLIMPIINSGGIYFRDDQIWQRLVWNFKSNGFKVINDANTWDKLLKTDYDLSILSDAQALEISKLVDADLIIYKSARSGVSKVFDRNKKEFVVYEDLFGPANNDIRSSGMNARNNLDSRYTRLVMKLKGLGY
jgi:hypothetical protein